jgi:hypothetical protein
MTKAALLTVLLVAAALAGCTGGSDDEDQPPADSFTASGTTTGTSGDNETDPPRGQGQQGSSNLSYEAHLDVSPNNGTVPLNVTIEVDVTWCDQGRHLGQDGNGTAGSSGNQTSTAPSGTGTGNGTGGNGTGSQGQGQGLDGPCGHPLNPSRDNLTWTLEVRFNATAANATADGNATGNGTASSNSTGTSTTTTTGSSNGTTTGNATGNGTGNGTGGNSTGSTFAHGDVVASFNGTGADFPSNHSVLLNESGSYDAVFVVTYENGTNDTLQEMVAVGDLPPGSPLGNETQEFTGSFLAPDPLLCSFGETEFEWVLNGTFNGTPAEVGHVNVTVETAGFADIELTFLSPNGTEIQTGTEINATGPFVAGNYTLVARSCVSIDASFVATAVAHYVSLGRMEA